MATSKTPKKYFHDHGILLLVSLNAFLTIGLLIFVLARLTAGHGNGYIVQYRSTLGASAFKQGGVSALLSFIVFGFLTLAITTMLSMRVYGIKRQLSVVIMGFGTLLVALAFIISNALLVLH